MAASGTPAAPCTMLQDCNNRVSVVLDTGGFHHLPANNEDKDLIKETLARNPVKQAVATETRSNFSEQTQQKSTHKFTGPTSQNQKRPTSANNEKQQSPPPQQTASDLKESQMCQDEFNRMRERLFRMLSKVPIQVETQFQQVQDLTSSRYQDTSSFTSSSSSSVTCSSSTSSSGGSSHHHHHQQQQQHHHHHQQHKAVIDREPLIIKYYHERSLEEILELHFGCSLIKHHQNEFGGRLASYEQLSDQQNYELQTVNNQEVLTSTQTIQDQPHYHQQSQLGPEAQYQGWQPPGSFTNSVTTVDYSWHPYEVTGGFFNNKIPSLAAITSNGNDKCNRGGNSHQQSSRRTKDNMATNGRIAAGGRQMAKRVRGKRSSNSGSTSQCQTVSSSLLQPTSNSATNVGSDQQQHHQHLTPSVAAIFTAAAADNFHQPTLAAPNQYSDSGHQHHHLYTYQSSVDTSVSSEAGMLSFSQATQAEPSFVGQGELTSTTCGHHYNDDLQQHHHQQHQSHQHQHQANYYQPTAGLIYQQAQVHSGNLYTPPVPLEPSAANEHQHHFQHHQHHHNHHQHQHQHLQQQQQQPMIEQQPDYVAGTDPHPHRIAFYPQAGTGDVNGGSYVFTPQSAPAQEASLSYSGQQPGGQLEMVDNGPLGPAPGKWQTTATSSRQSHSQ